MARARNLKPSFFTNDRLAEIHPLGRLLFAGLWTIADREGRLEDRPKRIKAEVLPYDNANVDKLLDDLGRAGFILRYAANGDRFIQVLAFNKHQNPHVKEGPSTIPAPVEHSASPVPDPEIPAPAGLIPDSGFPQPDSGLRITAAPPLPGNLTAETWAAWRTHFAATGKTLSLPAERTQLARLAKATDPERVVLDTIAAGHRNLPPEGGWPERERGPPTATRDKRVANMAELTGQARHERTIEGVAERVGGAAVPAIPGDLREPLRNDVG